MVNAEQEIERLVYIPGVWRCAKCGFGLVQSNLNARDGSVTARDDPGEKCPNDGAPLWRVTYKDELAEAYERWEEQAASLQSDLDAAREALRDCLDHIGDWDDDRRHPMWLTEARTTLANIEKES